MLGVTLIADGRRQDNVGQDIGPNPPGQGAEITLAEVPTLSALGLTMTGPRPGGFGTLNDRTNQICGAGDLICASPESAFSIVNLPQTLETLSGGAAGAGACAVQHPGVLEPGRQDLHPVDAVMGAGPDRQCATPAARLSNHRADDLDCAGHSPNIKRNVRVVSEAIPDRLIRTHRRCLTGDHVGMGNSPVRFSGFRRSETADRTGARENGL